MASFDVSYTYDAVGNRKTMLDNLTGEITTYTYDAANQLLAAEDSSGVTTFTYDQDGNRTRKETPSSLTDYTYDGAGRLTLAEPIAGDVTLTYNGDGQRVRKETPTETRKYLYDHRRLLQELDDDGNPLKAYTSTTDEYGDLISEYDFDDNSSSFHLYDAQWSTDALADINGDVTDAYKYRAFGLQSHETGASDNAHTFVGKQGYYRDDELDLYFLGMGGNESRQGGRFYDPELGRFMTEDPKRRQGGDENLYRYVGNNPINAIDPSGLELLLFEKPNEQGDAIKLLRPWLHRYMRRRNFAIQTPLSDKKPVPTTVAPNFKGFLYSVDLLKGDPNEVIPVKVTSIKDCIGEIPQLISSHPRRLLQRRLSSIGSRQREKLEGSDPAFEEYLYRILAGEFGDQDWVLWQDSAFASKFKGVNKDDMLLVPLCAIREGERGIMSEGRLFLAESAEQPQTILDTSIVKVLFELGLKLTNPEVLSRLIKAGDWKGAFKESIEIVKELQKDKSARELLDAIVAIVRRLLQCLIRASSLSRRLQDSLLAITDALIDSLLEGSLDPLLDEIENQLVQLLLDFGMEEKEMAQAMVAFLRALVLRDPSSLVQLTRDQVREVVSALDLDEQFEDGVIAMIELLLEDNKQGVFGFTLRLLDREVDKFIQDTDLPEPTKAMLISAWRLVRAKKVSDFDALIGELEKLEPRLKDIREAQALRRAIESGDQRAIFETGIEFVAVVLERMAENAEDEQTRQDLKNAKKVLFALREHIGDLAELSKVRDLSNPLVLEDAITRTIRIAGRVAEDLERAGMNQMARPVAQFAQGGQQLRENAAIWWGFIALLSVAIGAAAGDKDEGSGGPSGHDFNDPLRGVGGDLCPVDSAIGYKPLYGALDRLERPTGVRTRLRKDMIGEGSRASVDPPGWDDTINTTRRFIIARGHLLAESLGGSGNERKNIVTICHRSTNLKWMASVEAELRKHVFELEEDVYFEVVVGYHGNRLVPARIFYRACSRRNDEKNSVWDLERDLWTVGIANQTDVRRCPDK